MTEDEIRDAAVREGGPSALQRLADIWFQAGRDAAIRDVIEEWEKPWGLTDGRRFIERLKGMK